MSDCPDLNQLQIILFAIFFCVSLVFLYIRRKGAKSVVPSSWVTLIVASALLSIGVATAIITAIGSGYYAYTGDLYPGQSDENMRTMMLYCIVALIGVIVFGVSEFLEVVNRFTKKKRK